MYAGKNILLAVLLLFSGIGVSAQQKTKSELQKEKQESVERIKEVEKILSETSARKKNTLGELAALNQDRKSTRLNSSHVKISYAVFCLKKKTQSIPDQGDAQGVHTL